MVVWPHVTWWHPCVTDTGWGCWHGQSFVAVVNHWMFPMVRCCICSYLIYWLLDLKHVLSTSSNIFWWYNIQCRHQLFTQTRWNFMLLRLYNYRRISYLPTHCPYCLIYNMLYQPATVYFGDKKFDVKGDCLIRWDETWCCSGFIIRRYLNMLYTCYINQQQRNLFCDITFKLKVDCLYKQDETLCCCLCIITGKWINYKVIGTCLLCSPTGFLMLL